MIRTYVRADQAVCCSVRDAGSGLTPEAAAHVFDPFFTTKPEGTGLGLSISRTIIEDRHEGELWVESSPGGGATFTFALPAALRPSDEVLGPDES